jgi:hypothetical protein
MPVRLRCSVAVEECCGWFDGLTSFICCVHSSGNG